MATDMSLGGGSFGAGYTPIQFAPLVSLTGPVMAPATPAAPEAAAPLIRPPMMVDQGGGYEVPSTYQGPPIGDRLATPGGRAAEFQNLSRAASALMSPFTTIPSLVMTGKTPMELMAQAMGIRGAQSAQARPQNPFANVLGGLQNFLFGPQRESVPLGPTPLSGQTQGGVASIGGIGGAAYNDAFSIASNFGLSTEAAESAGRTAAGLVAQGLDPQTAITLAANYAAYADRSQMPSDVQQGVPAQPMGASMLGGNMQAFGGYTQGGWDDPDRPEGYGGGTAGETGAPGESSYGLDR